jgi:hypothetical protein
MPMLPTKAAALLAAPLNCAAFASLLFYGILLTTQRPAIGQEPPKEVLTDADLAQIIEIRRQLGSNLADYFRDVSNSCSSSRTKLHDDTIVGPNRESMHRAPDMSQTDFELELRRVRSDAHAARSNSDSIRNEAQLRDIASQATLFGQSISPTGAPFSSVNSLEGAIAATGDCVVAAVSHADAAELANRRDAILRQIARRLDDSAADLEDLACYAQADQIRANARQLRLAARRTTADNLQR